MRRLDYDGAMMGQAPGTGRVNTSAADVPTGLAVLQPGFPQRETPGIALQIQQGRTTPMPWGGHEDHPSISRSSISATVAPAIDGRTILQRRDEVSMVLRMLGELHTSGVILSGESGTGKSTLAAMLYHCLQLSMRRSGLLQGAVTTGEITAQTPPRTLTGIRYFVWLSLGPNATLPDVIAAILSGINMYPANFFFLKPEQQIGLLAQGLRRPEEYAFVVLDQFEELLNPERAEMAETSSSTQPSTSPAPTGRGAIALFFEMLQRDIGTSRLLLTSSRSLNGYGAESLIRAPLRSTEAMGTKELKDAPQAPLRLLQNGHESRIRSYLVSHISISEGMVLLQQRGVQGSHQELSLVWQRYRGHVFALVLFCMLTNLGGFSLNYLLNAPDYATMWNGDVIHNLIRMLYSYLKPMQRSLMRALCLFNEPVPLDAIVTAMIGVGRNTEDADAHHGGYNGGPGGACKCELSALVELSLVQEQSKGIGQHKYLLHPLLRQYTVEHYLEGSERQGDGGLSTTLGVAGASNAMADHPEIRKIALAAGHMRVAAYYARLVQEYCPLREQRSSLSDVEPILAMIQHLCLGWHWQEAYHLLCAEGLHESMLQWGALNALIGLYTAMLPPLSVLNRHNFGEISSHLGVIYSRLGDYVQSRAYYEQALKVQREVGDGYGEAVTLANQGEIFRSSSEWQQALSNFQQALAASRQHRDAHVQTMVLHNLGVLHQAAKDYAETFNCYVKSLKLAHTWKDRYNEGMTLSGMGLLEQGHLPYEVSVRPGLQAKRQFLFRAPRVYLDS